MGRVPFGCRATSALPNCGIYWLHGIRGRFKICFPGADAGVVTENPGPGSARRGWVWTAIIATLLVLSWLLTYVAGGTRSPLPHVFYLPIVIAGGFFGLRGSLPVAVVAGVLAGPLMPLSTETGVAQPTSGWLIRLAFFALIGMVVGVGRNRLLELSRARQSFLNVVSHELRTPLASVLGFASLLAERADDLTNRETEEFAGFILKEAYELSNVVDHYILEGRLSDSALFIDSRPTDLRRIVDIVLDGLPPHVADQRVVVEGDDIVCIADPLRLRQIVRTMLNNAIAYTANRIEVSVIRDGHHALVAVSDGQTTQDRNLNPITALTSMTNRATSLAVSAPLGIGLAVSRDLARRMKGDLIYQVHGAVSYELRLPLYNQSAMR